MSAHLELFSWSENLLQRNLNIKNSTRCSFWFMKILVQRWLTHLSLKIIPFKTSEVNAKNFIQITKHLFIEKSSTTIMNDSYQFQVPLEVWRERKRSKWAWLDKAHRLSISIVIWILSSDTICQLNKFNKNSEAAMLSRHDTQCQNSMFSAWGKQKAILPSVLLIFTKKLCGGSQST